MIQFYSKIFRLSILSVLCICYFNLANAQDCTYELSVDSNSPSCYGASDGNATVSSTGCNCQFSGCQFIWSHNGLNYHAATDLAPGEYTVTVIHAPPEEDCVLEMTVVIKDLEPFFEKIQTIPASCNGAANGAASFVPNPNAGPIDYKWSDGSTGQSATGLKAGTYTVSMTNVAGCTVEEEVIIEAQESDLVVEVEEVTNACNQLDNGSAQIMVEGGKKPYTYNWNGQTSNSNRVEGLGAGEHTVIVTDADKCAVETTLKIEDTNMSLEVAANKTTICQSGQVMLNATPNMMNYQWTPATGLSNPMIANPIATPTATTTYKVTATSADGCTGTSEVTIKVEDSIKAPTINVGSTELCEGETTFLSALYFGGGVSFEWEPATGLTNTTVSNTNASPTETTTYTVMITNAAGCQSSESVTLVVNKCTGTDIESLSDQLALSISPNPSSDYFNFDFGKIIQEDVRLKIYNANGQQLYNMLPKKNIQNLSLDLSTFKPGLYLAELQIGAERIQKKLYLH